MYVCITCMYAYIHIFKVFNTKKFTLVFNTTDSFLEEL